MGALMATFATPAAALTAGPLCVGAAGAAALTAGPFCVGAAGAAAPIAAVTTTIAIAIGRSAAGPVRSTATRPIAITIVAIAGGALLDDRLEVAARQQFEQTFAAGLRLGRNDRQHPDAVEVVFGLHLDLVTDRGAIGQQSAVEGAARLACAGRSPRPGSVRARARQFDVDPSRHSPHSSRGSSDHHRPEMAQPLIRRSTVRAMTVMAFPGHAGRCWSLTRWRSLARTRDVVHR